MSERVKREEQQANTVSAGAELKESEGSTTPAIVGYSANVPVKSVIADSNPNKGYGIGANGTIVKEF